MRISGILAVSFPVALGFSIIPEPSHDLPFAKNHFSVGARALGQTYCASQPAIGDTKNGLQLLHTLTTNDEPRINIYYSPELDAPVLAFGGVKRDNLFARVEALHATAPAFVTPPQETLFSFGALVHKSYVDLYNDFWPQLKPAIKSVLDHNGVKKLYVFGHNVGGGHGALLTIAIKQEFGDVVQEMIFFGTPRIGNQQYANEFDGVFLGKYASVLEGGDFVPYVPAQAQGYHDASGGLLVDNGEYSWFPQQDDYRLYLLHQPRYWNSATEWFTKGPVNVDSNFGSYVDGAPVCT